MSAGAAGLDARLAALSQPMREAVLLRIRGRLRPSEIARRMGITTEEVAILLRAAAKELGLDPA